MLRSLSILVTGSFAVLAAGAVQAGVTGTLHINAGYNRYTIGLVPDKVVEFDASTELQMLTFQQDFPNTAVPPVVVYARSANAQMDADEGVLSGYVDAELDGIPPSSSAQLGIYVEADLRGSDYFTVESDVLDAGAEVEVAFRFDVLGNGPVSSGFNVYRVLSGGGTASVVNLSQVPGQLSYMGVVGDLYEIDYSLLVYGYLTPYGLSSGNHTKFVVSDYSANLYGGPTQPAVTLSTLSGHDYSEPVPEPSAELLEASALLVLVSVWRRRRGAYFAGASRFSSTTGIVAASS